jgi:hypothetical protein
LFAVQGHRSHGSQDMQTNTPQARYTGSVKVTLPPVTNKPWRMAAVDMAQILLAFVSWPRIVGGLMKKAAV